MIVGTWLIWLAGGLYHAFPILAWTLAGLGFARRMGFTDTDPDTIKPLNFGVWTWILGMAGMLIVFHKIFTSKNAVDSWIYISHLKFVLVLLNVIIFWT